MPSSHSHMLLCISTLLHVDFINYNTFHLYLPSTFNNEVSFIQYQSLISLTAFSFALIGSWHRYAIGKHSQIQVIAGITSGVLGAFVWLSFVNMFSLESNIDYGLSYIRQDKYLAYLEFPILFTGALVGYLLLKRGGKLILGRTSKKQDR